MKFEEFSYAEAPRINGDLPGNRSLKILKLQREIEGSALSYPIGLPIVMDEGRGVTVKDVDGNVYIDLFAGAGVLALGHCNPIILEAVRKQQSKITHTLDFPTEIRLELIESIRKIMPGQLRDKVKVQFGGPTGSDAVESAIKLAKWNTKRHALIAFEGGYHGMTATACSLTSGKFWKENYLPMIPEVHFIPYAYCYRCSLGRIRDKCQLECAAYYEHALEDPHSGVVHPAASIIEPIQGEGGSIVPPDEYIKKIEEISRAFDVPLIFDEIQAGFCRTGEFFSFQHSKASPDIVTMSKALGGGFPLSAIAYKEDLDVWKKAAHIGTFRGNVTAMAAGVASIEFFIENDINKHVKEIGAFMLKELKTLEYNSNIVGEIRGKGLMIGVEFVEDKETKIPAAEIAAKVREEGFIRGILVEIGGHYNNVARFLPPLIITKELAGIGVEIFKEAVQKVENNID